MGDEGSTINPSSMSIRKAINKNQAFDKELKKELHYLDLKKKSSEKAFEHRKNQFIRKRLCINHLGKSQSSSHDGSLLRQRRLGTFGELQNFSSLSTGNLLESITQRGLPSSVEKGEQIIKKKFHKLSLDCSKLYKNDDESKVLVRLASGKRIEKSHSWSEDLSAKDSNEDIKAQHGSIPSTSLQVPSLPKFFRSQSAETLHKTSKANDMEEVNEPNQKNNNKNLSHLRAPVLDKRRSRSAEHLAMPSINARASNRSPSTQPEALERQHSFSEERRPLHMQTGQTKPSTRLVLPPLTRQRSKSVEIHDKHVVRRVRANSDVEPPNFASKPEPPSRPRNEKAKVPRKASSFGETEKKERSQNNKNENQPNDGKLRRSSSTPDLLDLGSEVEYLLMDDDQTRLQRMRAAVRALSFVANVKECRYLRNFNAFHQNEDDDEQDQEAQTSSNVSMPVITQNSSTPKHCNKEGTSHENQINFLEESQNETVLTTGDSTDLSRDSDEPIGHLDGSLGSSNASTLAEMFEEIKKTRYLRMPGRNVDDDDDDDVDVLMTSHGYNTPMIIVGCTKSVLMEDNTL